MSKVTQKELKSLFDNIGVDNAKEVALFLKRHPKNVNIWGRGNRFYLDKTPLMYAIQADSLDCARLLLNAGADVNAKMRAGPKTPTINFLIGYWVDLPLLETLLKTGADPNTYDSSGEIPLKIAILNSCGTDGKSKRVIEMLLEHGADPEFSNKQGDTPAAFLRRIANDVPEWVFDIIGIPKPEREVSVDGDADEFVSILEHPDGTHRTAYQALREGISKLFDEDMADSVTVCLQGGTEAGIEEVSLHLSSRLLGFPHAKITDELLSKCRIKMNRKHFKKGANGKTLISEVARPNQIAALLESIAKYHFELPRFEGDYAVEIYMRRS